MGKNSSSSTKKWLHHTIQKHKEIEQQEVQSWDLLREWSRKLKYNTILYITFIDMDQNTILHLAEVIWNYHHMNHIITPSDIVMVLWSHDIRVADRWVELLQQWIANKILFSWGVWRLTNDDKNFIGTTEAEKFAQRAKDLWIPEENIIIENRSTNTGENISFSYEIIKDLQIQKIILVQKPYMERRTFATFDKQRPWQKVEFLVTSPQFSLQDYITDEIPLEKIIHMMIGDLQRIIEYPALWFQTYQEVPNNVLLAYKELISLWYTNHLIK